MSLLKGPARDRLAFKSAVIGAIILVILIFHIGFFMLKWDLEFTQSVTLFVVIPYVFATFAFQALKKDVG